MNDKDRQEEESIAQLKAKAKAIEVVLQRKEETRRRAQEEDPHLLEVEEGRYCEGEQLLKRLTPKSKKEILASGTARELGYLFFAVNSASNIGNDEDDPFYVWKKDKDPLLKRLGADGLREADSVFASIYAMRFLENEYKILFKDFQRNATFLARWLLQWEIIKQTADVLNTLKQHRDLRREAELNYKACIGIADSFKLRYGEVQYDKDKGRFIAIACEELKGAIVQRRNYVSGDMREVKALVTALEDYLQDSNLKLNAIPYKMALYTLDIKIEEYIKCLHLDSCYLKSKINERIANGEAPTQEEINRAVFADYYEIEADEYYIKKYKQELRAAKVNCAFLSYFDTL